MSAPKDPAISLGGRIGRAMQLGRPEAEIQKLRDELADLHANTPEADLWMQRIERNFWRPPQLSADQKQRVIALANNLWARDER